MKNRDYLKPGQSIMLSIMEDGSVPEKYTIQSVIGEGGSTICYEAARERNGYVKTGKLKEFYPADAIAGGRPWYYSLKRQDSGQLVYDRGTLCKFSEMCEDYINTYRELEKIMATEEENQILRNYIQDGEILYSTSMEPKGTVYIWTSGVKGQCFDEYLFEIKKEPYLNSDEKLYTILKVVYSLTDCIKALHTAGLLHLDIKPSNFLVPYDSNMKIRENSISLFDINTLHSVKSRLPKIAGTPAYRAPEVLRGRADNRADIYSIGAMLFNAIIVSDAVPDGLYKPEYYPRLEQFICRSSLICSSEVNSDIYLMSLLARILKKCLAKNPAQRYASCTKLMEDLNKAEKYLLPYVAALTDLGPYKKMVIVDKEESLQINDPAILMQKLLYECPLYKTGNKNIQVFVAGSGIYGQKFVDICLQAGQILDTKLSVKLASDSPYADADVYMKFRPAINKFLNISVENNVISKVEDPYAELQFSLLDARNIEEKYDYIFVSLGNDEANKEMVNQLKKYNTETPISYTLDHRADLSENLEMKEKNLFPIYINEEITHGMIDKNLERMAFNTHISWKESLNINMEEEYKEFIKNKYNYFSSMAFALSIKYKLHSVGIELGEDLLEAALRFEEEILNNPSPEAIEKLKIMTYLEHKRWTLNRITEGWQAPLDAEGNIQYEACILRGSIKDSVNKTHPCIVPSGMELPLLSLEYTRNHRAKWDEKEIEKSLDELDLVSIKMHQCFSSYAENYKKTGQYQSRDLEYIESLIAKESTEINYAFKQFKFCLRNIVDGVENYSRQYRYYVNSFKKSLTNIAEDTRQKILDRLSLIDKEYFPIIERNLYIDYKYYDLHLVKKIPFIMTYKQVDSLTMAFYDGTDRVEGKRDLLNNIAAATVLCPAKLQYLYWCDSDINAEIFLRQMQCILSYCKRRELPSKIKIMIAVSEDLQNSTYIKLDSFFGNVSSQIEDYVIKKCSNEEKAIQFFISNISKDDIYNDTVKVFKNEENNQLFMNKLYENNQPYFKYNWKNKTFTITKNCEYLSYIHDKSSVTISDIFSLIDAEQIGETKIDYIEEYQKLWDIFKLSFNKEYDQSSWKRLCEYIQIHNNREKYLADIEIKNTANALKKYTQYIPKYAGDNVRIFMDKLISNGLITSDSYMINDASDVYKLEIFTNEIVWNSLKTILSKPQTLMMYSDINIIKKESQDALNYKVIGESLEINNMRLKETEKDLVRLLKLLEEAGFINQLNVENDKVNFIFLSQRIKEIFMKEERIYTIYMFYETLKKGEYDDIGYEFKAVINNNSYEDVIDLILVKGFQTTFIKISNGDIKSEKLFCEFAENLGLRSECIIIDPQKIS